MINKLDPCRDFLWEGQGDEKRMHLTKWSEVVKPKSAEGLGLADLR